MRFIGLLGSVVGRADRNADVRRRVALSMGGCWQDRVAREESRIAVTVVRGAAPDGCIDLNSLAFQGDTKLP